MAMEKDLAEAQAAVRETLAQLRTVLEERDKACRERDSHQQRVARLEEAIVTSLGQRLEPCMSRHPVTVVMAAGSLIAKIGEAIGCEFEDGGDLLEAVKGLVRERDEARAELSKLREDYDSVLEANVSLLDGAPYVNARNAYRRGAEAMREACARVADAHCVPGTRDVIRAMPIPEEP